MPIVKSDKIEEAKTRLLADDVVGLPTETVYGLAASIASEVALKKVFALKKRPFFDPLIVHVASFKQAQSVVREWPPLADYVARVFWPGPLTLVLPKAESVNPLITSGLETVAVRYPRHEVAEQLIRAVGQPLAAPSANRFGKTSPSRAEHVASEFPDEDLLILDGGPCEVGLESTVISFSEEGKIRILRPGGVTEADLHEALKRFSQPVTIERAYGQEISAPGHLKHHYMPDVPLVLLAESSILADALTASELSTLRFGPSEIQEMVLDEDPTFAARQLYSELRRIAGLPNTKLIFVRRRSSQTGGNWDAIWDRITRAATVDRS